MRTTHLRTLLAGVLALSILVTAPSVSVGDPTARETSIRPLLDRSTIDVPDRSRVFPRVDASGGCGDIPGGRFDVDADPSDWVGTPTGVNGTGRYDGGEYIWTDYPFDDTGTGQLRYPGEGQAGQAQDEGVAVASPLMARYGANAADVVELRVAADDNHLYTLVELNFLNAVDSTVVGLGFDLDLDAATGFDHWPFGARTRTDGLDLFVTLHGTCGFVTTAGGDQPLDLRGGAVRVDTVHNVMEAAIPMTLLGGSAHLRVVAGAGLWAGDGWMQPVAGGGNTNNTDGITGARTAEDPAVFNLLFRDDEPLVDPNSGVVSPGNSPRGFQVQRQSEVLQSGTNGPYDVVLDVDRLRPGAISDPMILRRGDETAFTRQYRSRLDLEGLVQVANNQIVYLGRRQPYAVYLPWCYEHGCQQWPGTQAPLTVLFHGGSGSHINLLAEESGGRLARALDAEAGSVTAAPLGRGRRTPWWRGPGELDVLEVIEDAERAYGTDPDRRLATGPSLGGYATLRMASLYPDLWAGAAPHCPATYENSASSRAAGNELPGSQTFTIEPVVPNMLNVAYRQTSGTGDPLVRITSGHRLRDAAFAAGLDAWYTEYLNSSHCFLVPAITGGWLHNHAPEMADLLRRGRADNPARVRYVVDARHYPAGPEVLGVHDLRDLGVRYHGAYWVSGLVIRPEVEQEAARLGRLVAGNSIGGPGPEVTAWIDAAAHAGGDAGLTVENCGDSIGFAGLMGGNPSAEPDRGQSGFGWNNPNRWQCQRQMWSGAPAKALDLKLHNLAAATIDLGAAGMHAPRVSVAAAGDGPVTVTFTAPGFLRAEGSCAHVIGRSPGSLIVELELPCTFELRRGS